MAVTSITQLTEVPSAKHSGHFAGDVMVMCRPYNHQSWFTVVRLLSRNNSGQVVYTHVPQSPRAMKLRSWEGNRRSGVKLAMRHRLNGLSTCGLNGLERRWASCLCSKKEWSTPYFSRSSAVDANHHQTSSWPVSDNCLNLFICTLLLLIQRNHYRATAYEWPCDNSPGDDSSDVCDNP